MEDKHIHPRLKAWSSGWLASSGTHCIDTDNLPKKKEQMIITSAIAAGHCSQKVYFYAASAGLSVVTRTSIDMKKMAEILKLRPQQLVIIGQTIGYPKQ
jgi:nitroreductase